MVSFRRGRKGWVISIANPKGNKTFRGWWNANYTLNEMEAAEKRQAERVVPPEREMANDNIINPTTSY